MSDDPSSYLRPAASKTVMDQTRAFGFQQVQMKIVVYYHLLEYLWVGRYLRFYYVNVVLIVNF